MYDPPAYLWAITIAGPVAVAALTCIVLYGGAERAGLGRRRAALLAGLGVDRSAVRQRPGLPRASCSTSRSGSDL